jgi:hypothetical protein
MEGFLCGELDGLVAVLLDAQPARQTTNRSAMDLRMAVPRARFRREFNSDAWLEGFITSALKPKGSWHQ